MNQIRKRINKLGISGIGELHPDIQGFDLLDFNLMGSQS